MLKKCLTILLALVTLSGVVACGTENGSTATTTAASGSGKDNTQTSVGTSDGSKTVLRMAWWGSQTRHDMTVKVIEMYEAAHPDIDIQYEFYDSDGYFAKLNTLVASNTVWDIFQVGGNFPTYLDKIVPLDDYIADKTVDISDIEESFLATTKYQDKQLALSSGVNTYGIAYDPALLKEAGVPEPKENWTWDDFSDACLKIHDALGIYGFSNSNKLNDFIMGASMGIAQEDYKLNFFALSNDKLGFDDPSMLTDYMTMRKELVDAGAYPDPGAMAEIKDIEGDYLVTGEAAMSWVASNQLTAMAKAAGREIKIAPVPRKTQDGPSGAAVQSSQMLCISKDSKAPEEAAKFINYFVNDLEANKILNGERGVPINTTIRESFSKDATGVQKEMYDFLSLIGSFKTGEINLISPPETDEIRDQYCLLLEQVIYGEKTPEEASKEIYDFAAAKLAG